MTGRPSDYSPAVAGLICARLAEGETLTQVCRDEEMPGRSTVHRWLDAHESFRDAYARARAQGLEVMAEQLLEIADDGSADYVVGERGDLVADHEHIQRSRLRVDTRKWLLGRLLRQQYGDRVEVEHSGNIGRADDLSDDELAAIAAGRGARADVAQEAPD